MQHELSKERLEQIKFYYASKYGKQLTINNILESNNRFYLQKFLVFVELFKFINKQNINFKHLKAYKYGPIFRDVIETKYLDQNFLLDKINTSQYLVNQLYSKAYFLVDVLNFRELLTIMHDLDFWKNNYKDKEANISISAKDISIKDLKIINFVYQSIPKNYLEFHKLKIKDTTYLVSYNELHKLSTTDIKALSDVALNNNLNNPVYITFSQGGEIIID